MATPTTTRPTRTERASPTLGRHNGHRPRPTEPSAWFAGLRIATGFVFLWAFVDKLFGLGYSTPSERAWLNGGSPTKGFLGSIDAGPFASTFRSMAGDWWVDWLFMLGLLGIGAAVVLGIGLRLAAVSGTLLLALMWIAEWHPARYTAAGEATGSTNPLIDYHVIYALALIVVAVTAAGNRWGLGRAWARLPFVRRHATVLS
ncbi:DoxX family membrane protein [Actinomarinicola tropica]|uniref:DoxX family membrane protein n=1 Tax=Actinomarinicola tropica TaxID=2789776 RepID=A0A5Q2RBF7_9ACTN|nr:DoxX family membrane protein [Actinomarinicola tropica]QGG94158.1 DoxX family membrane protein [Actinomarinicola tropica]